MDPLTALPDSFTAGTTVKYRRSHADFPASQGWVLTLFLAGKSTGSWTANPVGDDFDFHLPPDGPTGTTRLEFGTYAWFERAEKDGEAHIAAEGTVVVEMNLATAAPGEAQSRNERLLAIVDAAMEGTLASGMQSYRIYGREVSKFLPAELAKLRDTLAAKVARERSGGALTRQHLVTFNRS